MEAFGEQVISAASAARTALDSIHPSQAVKRLLPHLLAHVKHYLLLLFYFLALRKVYRMICGKTTRKQRRHSHRKTIRDADGRGEPKSNASSDVGSADRSSYATYFSASSDMTPGKNEVIVGDGVVVVNRNDRYVEVYERKKLERVDNVDDQVEALLKEFSSRNKK